MADPTSFLNAAFPLEEHDGLKDGIRKIIAKNKTQSMPVFTKISNYIQSLQLQILEQREQIQLLQQQQHHENRDAPSPKKRKLGSDGGLDRSDAVIRGRGNGVVKKEGDHKMDILPSNPGETLLTITDISFSVPMRKKLTILITTNGLSAIAPATGNTEFGISWSSIRHIALLPQPERATKQFNLVIFPEGSEGLGADSSSSSSTTTTDALVFTLPDTPPKTASGPALSSYDVTSYTSLFTSLLNTHLPQILSPPPPLLQPTQSEFLTTTKKAYITCHRGSKEGYLFLLSTGILFAFKKPLLFFEFANIDSISYTSITKRTFNLNIHVSPSLGSGDQEIEFSMIDQAEYTGIDAYVKRHELNDKSMAEKRRAVKYNVNKSEDGDGDDAGAGENGGGESGISELQKALEDAEDEEEEDYDPGSEGDSDGSGDSSEEDDDDGGEEDEGDDEDDSGGEGVDDLREELGSELEDVEITDDEAQAQPHHGRKMDTRRG